ncbi:hypothetical protein ABBQ38_008154 [Trebouxia sp. C0009 RCD-2024]
MARLLARPSQQRGLIGWSWLNQVFIRNNKTAKAAGRTRGPNAVPELGRGVEPSHPSRHLDSHIHSFGGGCGDQRAVEQGNE